MAVKKKATSQSNGSSVEPARAAPSEAESKPAEAPPTQHAAAADLAVASETAPKAGTPAAGPTVQAAAPKAKSHKPAAAPIKLTDRQLEFLKKIHQTKESGYLLEKKADQRTLDALADKKLIKKGAKDKDKGLFRYLLSKAGEKQLSATSTAPA